MLGMTSWSPAGEAYLATCAPNACGHPSPPILRPDIQSTGGAVVFLQHRVDSKRRYAESVVYAKSDAYTKSDVVLALLQNSLIVSSAKGRIIVNFDRHRDS